MVRDIGHALDASPNSELTPDERDSEKRGDRPAGTDSASPTIVHAGAHMAGADASDKSRAEQVEDLETLARNASDLTRNAQAATQAYERTAWIKYAAIFIPIPFAVLLLRLHLEAWGYYVAGGLFIAVALVMFAWDLAALARRDDAIRAAERAQAACESAQRAQQDA